MVSDLLSPVTDRFVEIELPQKQFRLIFFVSTIAVNKLVCHCNDVQ
jgi:hypothetical protein